MQLYTYDIVNNCNHLQVYHDPIEKLPIKLQKKLIKLEKSEYCVRRIYSLVDDIFKNIFEKLNQKQIYSTIVQLTYIIYLMNTNKYVHCDMHSKNIGVLKINKKLKIFNKLVPTLGYQYIILDFGLVLHPNFLLNKEEKERYNYFLNNEINTIIKRLIIFEKNDFIKKLVNINYKTKHESIIYSKFLKSAEYILLEKFALNDEDRFYLYQIIFPGSFQKEYLGINFTKIYMPILKCTLLDLLYFFKNKNNFKKIINYFVKKI